MTARSVAVAEGHRVVDLIVPRGLPGCGKTTRALAWVAEQPGRRARVCRDDLRLMLHGVAYSSERELEDVVTAVEHQTALGLLLVNVSVVIDATNLPDEAVADFEELADTAGARLVVWDMRDVPPQVCIDRIAERVAAGGRHVPAEVVHAKYERYIAEPGPDHTPVGLCLCRVCVGTARTAPVDLRIGGTA